MTAQVVVFANEKGGTGKSTLAMHLIISSLREGKKVASFDLDGRQGTLSRYLQNREEFIKQNGIPLPMPVHTRWTEEMAKIYTITGQIEKALDNFDLIVVDTPGAYNALTMTVITMADSLVTPLNDSLIDIDVLADLDENSKIKGPSQFSQVVWSARQQRMLNKKPPLNWLIVRNRLLYTKTKNSKLIEEILQALSRRIHFNICSGVSERVIYRELFLKGLTMMDCKENGLNMPMSFSAIMARQEIRTILSKVFVPDLASEKKSDLTNEKKEDKIQKISA